MNEQVTRPDEVAARAKLAALIQEHRDLDAAIEALAVAGAGDQLALSRLKKRKLQLKDEITEINNSLLPGHHRVKRSLSQNSSCFVPIAGRGCPPFLNRGRTWDRVCDDRRASDSEASGKVLRCRVSGDWATNANSPMAAGSAMARPVPTKAS